MPAIYGVSLFVFLIIVLSTLRQRLVYELSGTSLLIFGSTRPGIILYSFIFLPGTIVHELSHWVVAEILQVRTGEISIFPDEKEVEGGQRSLGSVATERSDPFRAFLIGIAPFISGLMILAVLGNLLASGWTDNYAWWQIAILIYGIMVTGNSMMISQSDRRTWPFILVILALIAILVYRQDLSLSPAISTLISTILHNLNLILGVTAGINLVMIGWSYALRRMIEKITKRKIIHK